MPEPRLRGAARDEAIRAGIEPLAPGERPRVVTVAACVSLALAVLNLIGAATGYSVDRGDDTRTVLIGLGALSLALAYGLLRVRYWAALGFQMAAALTAIWAGLSLMVASNLAAVALSAGVLAASGTLFWLMIRPMARIQAPRSKVDGHG